ncbi:MAG: hypothetical protein IT434_09565 [Phycisphaerales bacterium]|nr:hypothetical protein [Phycisphaerales bacterium]
MPEPKEWSLSEVVQIVANLGVDTSCGACMGIAFTGVAMAEHTCAEGQRADAQVTVQLTEQEP